MAQKQVVLSNFFKMKQMNEWPSFEGKRWLTGLKVFFNNNFGQDGDKGYSNGSSRVSRATPFKTKNDWKLESRLEVRKNGTNRWF